MESQKEFIESLFSKKERKKLWVLPAITKKEIDLEREKIVTWIHPSGHMGYVLYNDGNKFFAFMLERLTDKSESNKVCMCAWCLSVKSLQNITTFSKRFSENSSNSVMLCSDLNCLNSISNPGAHVMRESLGLEDKRQRYYRNVESYIAAHL